MIFEKRNKHGMLPIRTMNKRGNVFIDMLLIPVMLILVSLMMIFALKTWNEVKATDIFSQNEPGSFSDNQTLVITNAIDQTTRLYPFMFVMVIASMLVSLALTGYYVESSPTFLVVGILIIMMTITVAAPLANVYSDVANDPTFAEEDAQYGLIRILMNNLPLLVLMIGGTFLIALYSKKSSGPGGFSGGSPYGL